jgi:hypothetical protein
VSASIAASVIVIVFIIDSLALGDRAVKQAGLTDVPNVGTSPSAPEQAVRMDDVVTFHSTAKIVF